MSNDLRRMVSGSGQLMDPSSRCLQTSAVQTLCCVSVSSTWLQLSPARRRKFKTFHIPEYCSGMDEDLLDIISREFSFFSQEELEQALQQAREEIKADLGMDRWTRNQSLREK